MTLKIGHRGAAGHAPENTLLALEKGIALGADLVEFDVQGTRDGHLVLIHDKRVDRTTDGRGEVAELPLNEIRKLNAGNGQTVPLLEEALNVTNGRVGIVIEIKIEGIAAQVCSLVEAARFRNPIIYASFFHRELLEVRQTLRTAQTMALLEGMPVNLTSFAMDAQATHVGLALDSVTKQYVDALHGKGLRIFVYTVNDPDDIRWVKSIGADGIISDFPDRI
jgi:glycerophosphoryl diester phosphodiesterase